ncbi:MAG: methylisocitrate lyase [Acidimicrobiales bacterium]
MLHSSVTASEKRSQLRARISSGEILVIPGAFNPLTAMLIARKGFEAVYVSGAVLAADLGLPDVGLTTLGEVAGRTSQITRVSDLPTIVDADTGFGDAMNVARATQSLEDAGAAGMHIEDQVNPKRCGHLDGKEVVDLDVALQRIRASVEARRDPNFLIIARTDIRAVEDLSAAIDRARAYADAGADAVFPEALLGLGEFETMRRAIDVPILANATEFGKGDMLNAATLNDLGINIVIFPVSLLRLAMRAAEVGLDVLRGEGGFESVLPQMQTRAELYDLLEYSSYATLDEKVFNFKLS